MEEEPSPSPPEFVVSARSTPVPNDITAPSRTTAASTVKTSKKGFQMAPTLGGSSQGGAGTLGPNPAIVIPAKTSSKKKGGAAADAATAASKKKGVGSIKSKKVIDLDRHCGVKLDSGEVCSRSLKCKIHTVGMKRAVRGRSQNFDVLYADWTRKGATKEDPLFDALSPDDEVNTILTSLRLYKPMPLASRITPSIASWNRAKARLILTEALRQNA